MKIFATIGILILFLFSAIIVGDFVYGPKPIEPAQNDQIVYVDSGNWLHGTKEIYSAGQNGVYYSFTAPYNLEIDYNYVFPTNISVDQGDSVRITIKSLTPCLFKIDGYDVIKKLEENRIYELEFRAIIPGKHKFVCEQSFNRYKREGYLIVS